MEESPTRTLVLYEYVEDILERRGPHRDAHLAGLRRWLDEGRLVAAGAIGDPPTGAAIVLSVPPVEARAMIEEDPYVAAGLVTAVRVEPWNVVVR